MLAGSYVALLMLYRYGWRRLRVWEIPDGYQPAQRLTVLIPARNEAHNIGPCLESIVLGSYPANHLKIIVINDHSSDSTTIVVNDFQHNLHTLPEPPAVQLLHLPPGLEGKKQALAYAVARVDTDIVVTTDADCRVGADWLKNMAAAFERYPEAQWIGAPVLFENGRGLPGRFQALDFIGLMGITGAGIRLGFQRMGNGANMAYRKSAFDIAGGYADNDGIASGDDMFLIQKIARHFPGGIFFLKSREAAVWTSPEPDWPAFWRQRLRWGRKNAALPEWPVRLALLTVWLFCWCLLCVTGYAALGTAGWTIPGLALLLWGMKALADYLLLRELCRFFSREVLLRWFWPSFFLHTFYIAVVGLAGLWPGKHRWKGRITR